MTPRWSAGVVAAVIAASSLLIFLPVAHAATGIVAYVPITLTNNQGSATPSPFQQKISWNPSSYSTYEASDLGNIRFCSDSACITTLNAWLESCTSSCVPSATSASAWVKLASSIAGGGGTLTIYMTFLSTSTHFDGNSWGEAPTIPATYGTNDNGANVFNFYDNFAGTSLSSKWTTVKSAGGSVTVNNGATIATSSGNDYAFVVSATQAFPQVAESYMASASANTDPMMGVATGTSANSQVALASGYEVDNNRATGTIYLSAETASGGTLATSKPEAFVAGVWQMTWSATGAESASDGSVTLTGTSTTPAIANYGIYFGQSTQAAGNDVVDWGRMRAYPPGGVTPTAVLGTLVITSTTTTSTSSTTTSSTTTSTTSTTTTTTTSSTSTSSTSKTTTSSTTSTTTTTTSSTSASSSKSKTTSTTTSSSTTTTTTTSTSTRSAPSTSSQTSATSTTTSIGSTSTESSTTAGGSLAPILGIDPMLLGGVALAGGAVAVAVVFIRRRSNKLIPS